MRRPKEIKMLRSGKGLFTAKDVVEALAKEGIKMTPHTYLNKENGKTAFTAKEIRAMSYVFGMTIGEAMDIFS